VKALSLYALVSAVIIGASAAILTLAFADSGGPHAVWTSAVVAFGVQLLGFAIARFTIRENVIAGWGLGMLLRFAVLALYALVLIKALALAPAAALISLATFFFLSTLVEPLLLKL
jgi:hypothetical protein